MSKEIGIILKEARIKKKLTIDDIVNISKIRKFYLEAIEDGDFSELPGLTYTIGFIKSYAKLVDIDFEPLIALLKEEKQTEEESVHVGLASTRIERPLPSKKIVVVSLLLLLLFYIIWSCFSQEETITQESDNLRTPVTINKLQIDDNILAENKALETEEKEDKVVDKVSAEKLSRLEVSEYRIEDTSKQEEAVSHKKYGDIGSAKIIIRATEDSWIQLRKDGELRFSRVLLSGDEYYVSDYSDDMVLETGNAGGLLILAEGKEISSIGGRGVILRNFVLNKETLSKYR